MKKVLIFYASYGGGHLSAAKSIEECIKTNYSDIKVEIIDCMKYINKTVEKLTTGAYLQMAKKAPWAWGKIYFHSQKGVLSHISSRSNIMMSHKLLKLLKEKNPDLVISTHPFSTQMCSHLKKKGKFDGTIATVMTDFAPHDQWLVGANYVHYFFVSNEPMKQAIVKKGFDEKKFFVTGIPISHRFSKNYDGEKVKEEFGLAKTKKTVLFFGGGEFGLGKNKTLEILKVFAENFKDYQMIAIAGKNGKMKLSFEELVTKYNRQKDIKVLSFTQKVPELMSISDLVITKPGGLTTSESLACELPMLIINPIPGQEEENASIIEESGAGIWLKKEMDIKETLAFILENEKQLEMMQKNAKKLARKTATEDICSILLS